MVRVSTVRLRLNSSKFETLRVLDSNTEFLPKLPESYFSHPAMSCLLIFKTLEFYIHDF